MSSVRHEDANQEASYGCGNPACALPWPTQLPFCPFCGTEDSGRPLPSPTLPASISDVATIPPPAARAEEAIRALRAGENAPITVGAVSVTLAWTPPSAGAEVDASAYLLGPGGRVRQDADMIFYGQESGAAGALRLTERTTSAARFDLDLATLPADVEKVVFCASIDPAGGSVDFAALAPARVTLGPANARPAAMTFEPEVSAARLAALIFGEVYRRGDAWRFRAVGQGFAGGLGPLARSYGVDIAD